MTTARSVGFFVNLGLGLVFHGLLVKCCASLMIVCHYSSVARFQVTMLGGSLSQHKLPCDSHGPRLWPSYIPDLT
jgi:hypothetical protein